MLKEIKSIQVKHLSSSYTRSADNLATSERKLIPNYSQCSQAK